MQKSLRIALVGNPNSGKSSLFNALTGLRQKVGNYPGVTVDKKTGFFNLDKHTKVEVVDLPGTYSLYPRSIDEQIAFDVLTDSTNPSHPDLIVLVADASNLKRNLLLCSQLIDLQMPMIVALNMTDVASAQGIFIDDKQLSRDLDCPVVITNARNSNGINALKKTIEEHKRNAPFRFMDCNALAPETLQHARDLFPPMSDYALLLQLHQFKKHKLQNPRVEHLVKQTAFNSTKAQAAEIIERYKLIQTVVDRTVREVPKDSKELSKTSKIDKYLTHPLWGYVIFLLIFFLVFQAIFSWASYPMDWIDSGLAAVGSFLNERLPAGWLTDLLTEGILAGIGGVLVFVPQIMILFGFVSILEDTGYMARVSFLMDRLMRTAGLSGKSTVPLISGLACAIPAIMSTRTIDNWKDRIITIMVTPLMSCSARLPVYTLLVGFAVPDMTLFGLFNIKGLVMLGLYLLGFISAVGVAWFMKLFVKARDKAIYMMELPVYRLPRWSNVGITMFEKARVFVMDAGKIIVAISILLWFLASYGPGEKMQAVEIRYEQQLASTNALPDDDMNAQFQSEKLRESYAGHVGRFIEPAIAPLGFDWKIGIGLLSAFAAREVFVGTLATIYSVGSSDEADYGMMQERMRAEINPRTGKPTYSMATAFSLLIFFVFAMQCMSTLAVVKRETKSWKYPLIQVGYMTLLAWLGSFVVYQLLS
ncbi:MAG TPA: ferrous iron transport protein B [Chitinophagales bacterium]|nr:ferrous iron transport protein B [Chitinophagales bacterium]